MLIAGQVPSGFSRDDDNLGRSSIHEFKIYSTTHNNMNKILNKNKIGTNKENRKEMNT